jgi:hypothetical protein
MPEHSEDNTTPGTVSGWNEKRILDIEKSINQVEKKIDDLNKDKVSAITIISIFVAIITFVSVEVRLFEVICD